VPNFRHINGFHDGADTRLVPVEELGRAYKSVLIRKVSKKLLSHVDEMGAQKFREVLSDYLNASRGLQTTHENIMITRGSQMAIYLLTLVLFSKGENIIVGDTNYYYADALFKAAGMNINRVKVDDQGIDVDAVERLFTFNPRLAELVDLKYFAGFSFVDIAKMWGLSERTVQRDWEKARLFLHRVLSQADKSMLTL